MFFSVEFFVVVFVGIKLIGNTQISILLDKWKFGVIKGINYMIGSNIDKQWEIMYQIVNQKDIVNDKIKELKMKKKYVLYLQMSE